MTLKFEITANDYQYGRRGKPYIRFHKSGVIRISSQAAVNLKLEERASVVFLWDSENKDYYICRALDGDNGFECRQLPDNTSGGFMFNSVGLLRLMIERLDLPIAPDKKVSVKWDIEEKPIEHNGRLLFKIF